jgi:class 3 adenylate cyclase
MNCPDCQTENPDFARFCLNCGASLTMQCFNCLTDLPPNSRFCLNCGQPVRATTPSDDARLARLAASAPGPLTEKVRAAEYLPGERRVVTVLFADVVGSTALAGQVDPEAWMAIMNGAFDRITPPIYRYEGTIARLVGDGLWAFFGAPVAHEDDPLRAVRAAYDLLEAAQAYSKELRHEYGIEFLMRACVNTGPVVVGRVGDDLRYEYTAMGGTVNLAARLKFATEPMTVLITESTHRFVAHALSTVKVGQLDVKGRAEPVRVYRVHGAKAQPGSLRGLAGLESPMVGRDQELAALMHLCEAVRVGLGRAALIVGEPGLGKTRLIAEWKAAVQEHLRESPAAMWVEGHCLSYGQGLAYHLLLDLLRSIISLPDGADEAETRAVLLAFLQELLGEGTMDVYPYLGHLLRLKMEDEALQRVNTLDPQALQTQYLGALRKLLLAITARRPLVLILEDMHWADPSSTELLIKLLPLASAAPLLLCMVSRPDREAPGWRLILAARDVLGSSLSEITLGALSNTDSRQLVANLLEIEALSEQARDLILDKAEGNPFFVEEVIRMMIERGVVAWRDDGWVATADIEAVDIPDNLQGLLMARIDRLPEEVKRTLRVAAVIGRQFPVKVLAHVLEGE